MKTPIKLFVLSEDDNLIRLQSQLAVGNDYATHIFKDGNLMAWGKGERGFSFYKTDDAYEIIRDIKENETSKTLSLKIDY